MFLIKVITNTNKRCIFNKDCPESSVCNEGLCFCKSDFILYINFNDTINFTKTNNYHFLSKNNRCQKCEIGWTFFDGQCYLINDKEAVTWNDALSNCITKGGTLLKIDQDNEYEFSERLFNFVKNRVEDVYLIRRFWVIIEKSFIFKRLLILDLKA